MVGNKNGASTFKGCGFALTFVVASECNQVGAIEHETLIYLQSAKYLYLVTFSGNFNCVVSFIQAFICLLHE